MQVPLEGEELRAFLALQKLREEQREMENKTTAMEEEEEEEEDEEEEDDEPRDEGRVNGLHPLSSAPTPVTSSFYVFPYQEPKRTVDAYGEVGLSGFMEAGRDGTGLPADAVMADADVKPVKTEAPPCPPPTLRPDCFCPACSRPRRPPSAQSHSVCPCLPGCVVSCGGGGLQGVVGWSVVEEHPAGGEAAQAGAAAWGGCG